ncbi:MAG: peptidase T [Oligoflexia bacterium]|nr:peptidase T [Oligoflexia bacterium]
MKAKLTERFVKYVKIDTTSDPDSTTYPSTHKQFDLAKLLVQELQDLGIKDAAVDGHCYVTATIPSNLSGGKNAIPTIAFIAHMDTSNEVPGEHVKPQIISPYKGGDIALTFGPVIKMSESPSLEKCIGHTIITSDGSTLLGSDDKAGVAAIMTAAEYLLKHSEIKHGDIKIAFTPDEEIGQGVKYFDIKKFGADFAYTIDGGMYINKETFSADSAVIDIAGRNIHPGKAKNIMVNSIKIASEIITRLPIHMAPEKTCDYQPFIHPIDLNANVAAAKIKFILRDFNDEGLVVQKKILEDIISTVSRIYPEAAIHLKTAPSYRNMRKKLEANPTILERLDSAVKKAGVNLPFTPIRGGTDGSALTEMGLPTPNIFYGGENAHALTEWLSIDILEKSVLTIINIAEN